MTSLISSHPLDEDALEVVMGAVLDAMSRHKVFTRSFFVSKHIAEHTTRIVKRVVALLRADINGNRGNNDLLIGSKGSGKTTFFRGLATVLAEIFPDLFVVELVGSGRLRARPFDTFKGAHRSSTPATIWRQDGRKSI